MGNYQEHMKRISSQMLREISTGQQPQRVHIFGNPFKRDQVSIIIRCKSYTIIRTTE